MSVHKTMRLPPALVERVEAIAKEKRIKFSAALLFALQRGVAALEQEVAPAAAAMRRVFSKGVE